MRWTEEDFKAAAEGTQLKDRTLSACHDVLVKGVKAVDASAFHDVQPPHISRAIKRLGERLEEIRLVEQEAARSLRVSDAGVTVAEVFYKAAREAAQNLKGEGWIIREAVPGHVYEGTGVIKVGGYFVQDVGRVGVIHDMRNLESEPALSKRLEIRYSERVGEKARIQEIAPDRGTREIAR
ncbi:MAG: hypothetical protein BGO63_03975 [Candidatus Accumulibacter sp. 66-26]|nr:MAG: hypothetical protein BGO63_03975 [Candidatus Accumulibacter sp. 66-26]